ncbi:DUF202 domain-containing protein [Glycomyces tenuis]|uniref:DUF202 domain-containing protein n=1 Tax=Glycomyces tenuis TaxID=58116 RepID=UPI000405C573|nr:DUF202 domain-containing protein [Glycomyces tenuis]
MTEPPGPWDRGLQPERSNLAWRRTALGITAGSVLASRLLAAAHPGLGLVLPFAALAAGGILMAAAERRSDRLGRWLRARRAGGPAPAAPGGRLLLSVAVAAVLLAVAGAFLVLGA